MTESSKNSVEKVSAGLSKLRAQFKSQTEHIEQMVRDAKKTPESKRSFWKKIVLVALVVILLYQFWQIRTLGSAVPYLLKNQQELIDEVDKGLDEVQALKIQTATDIQSFGGDLNEVRAYLLLPTKNYGGANGDVAPTDEVDLGSALFKYVDQLTMSREEALRLETAKTTLAPLFTDEAVKSELVTASLTLASEFHEDEQGLYYELKDSTGAILGLIGIDRSSGKFGVLGPDHVWDATRYDTVESLKPALSSYIKSEVPKILAHLNLVHDKIEYVISLTKDAEVSKVMNERGLTISLEPRDQDGKLFFDITDANGYAMPTSLVLNLDTESCMISGSATANSNSDVCSASLLKHLQNLDLRSPAQRAVDAKKIELEDLFDDEAFQDTLKRNGLSLTLPPFESETRWHYDLKDKEGNAVGAIVIEKETAEVNVVDGNGENSQNLLNYGRESPVQEIALPDVVPEYADGPLNLPDSETILISGRHGSLTDTMIITNLNHKTRVATLISVPRDLFYQGRKINSVYASYGMPELVRELSDVTGLDIKHYILIDMYVFIEVIDLLDGVDIHLDEPVIDPTYRTLDNGKWSTLYYKPGDYHLSGKQVLRLARSRHTSSDFKRAERQQEIIKALQSKARSLGIKDAATLAKLAETVLSKTETDIQIQDALAYYFRYQGFTINTKNVMTSGNVLYSTMQGPGQGLGQCNVPAAPEVPAEGAADGETAQVVEAPKCAYILLPRDNNWNIIKWYVEQRIKEANEVAVEL